MHRLFAIACLCTLAIAASAQAKAKPGRYQIQGDGAVHDTATKLIWQQVVPAQAYDWSDAKAYCLSNTGLPGAGPRPAPQRLRCCHPCRITNPDATALAAPSRLDPDELVCPATLIALSWLHGPGQVRPKEAP